MLCAELPDVVVGPPGRVLSHVTAGNLSLQELLCVVVDEADLMMAYQHSSSIEQLWRWAQLFHKRTAIYDVFYLLVAHFNNFCNELI